MVAILYPRRLRELRDVTQPGVGLPDQGVPQLQSSNSSFVVETIAAGGGFSLGASNLGNTLGDTGVTGSRVVLAAIGNLSLSQATDINGGTVTISAGTAVAAAFSAGVSGGNTVGDTGVTGTRLVFAGGNSITLSQATDVNGGTITISGATTSQSLQTQGLFDLTISGNTAGAGALVSSGTLTLAGGSNITLSQNGNAISIIGGAGETQTAISGIANSQTTYTSGTVSLSALGALTIRSTTGNQFQFSVNSQTVQPETQTFVGGISASNTLYTSGTVNIVGSGIVTVQSGTGQRVIVNASQSVQPETQTFLGGLAGSNATYTSGTVTITGVGGGVTVSSNTGQRIDISVAAPVAQTVQTQNMVAATLSGNTSGALALMSSGTMTIAGGNNITVSQAGNAFTISGANAAGAQTAISGIAASNTTYTSGSVTFTGVGGGVTVSSNTGQRVDISVAAPVAQTGTQFSAGISGGNTSGNSGTVAGRVVFAGGNNITLSGSTNGASETITISAFTQSAESQSIGMSNIGNTSGTTGIASGAQVRMLFAGGNNITLSQSLNGASGTLTISAPNAQTAISGLANSQTTYTSGTVSLSELGAITIRSTTGNQFQFSVNSQTVQTQNMVAVTLSGNTSGAQALISSGTLTLAGGNNITVSQAGNAVTISGANVGGAQTGISGLANSQTTYTSGTVSLSELGAITIRSTTGNQFQFSVNAQSVQPETQTFVGGIANSQTTYTSGTVSLSELGAITIRSTTGNQYQLSVNAQTGTQFSAGISGGNTSGDTGTVGGRVVFAGGNNITLSGSTNGVSETITISAGAGGGFSGGVSNVGNSSGDTGITGSRLVFAGGNSITLSQSTNASGGTITVSAPNASVLSAVAPLSTSTNGSTISILGPAQLSVGFSTQGNTSGNTGFVTGQLQLVGSNGITLSGSTNAGSQTITISGVTTAAQTNQSGSAFAVGNTYSSSVGTFDARTLSIRGDGIISVAATNSGWRISASQSVQAETQTFVGGIAASNTTYTSGTITITGVGGGVTVSSNTGQRVDISVAAQTVESQSIGASNLGNTLGTSGVASGGQVRAVIIGTSNITVSQSVNGASATLSLIGQPSFSAGLSTGGNTQGNTGISGTRLVLVATNNITMSQNTDANGATISISGQAPTGGQFSAGVSTGGNTAGATGISGSQLVLVGTGAMSLSQTTGANGATVSINAPVTSSLSAVSGIKISTNGSTISIGYGQPLADWENMPRAQASLISHISGFSKTPIYWNDHLDGDITAKSFAFAVSMVTASQPLSLSAHLGIYTIVNSTSANLLGSVSEAYVVSSASSVSLSGVRNLIMTGIGTHTALSSLTGGEYLVGMMFSATATNAMNASLLGASGGAGALGVIFPGTNNLSTGTSQGIQVLAGRGSTTVNGMPAAVSAADLVNQGQGASLPLHPWIYIRS